MGQNGVFAAYQVRESFAKRHVLQIGISVQTAGLKIVIRYKLIKLFQKEGINGCKNRDLNMLSEGSFKHLKNILKRVTILALSCPSYIVKRKFPKACPFLQFFAAVYI